MKNYILFFSLFISVSSYAQEIKGKITNTKDIPVVDAQIFNPRTSEHTHTDQNGMYVFSNVVVGDSLQVFHITHERKTVAVVSESANLNVELTEQWVSIQEAAISPSINALKVISNIDTKTKPLVSSQEVLRQVPGLFIGQHAGGGKAEQIFLRGFDIDHGTDVRIGVDGIPVNMVSHAHGQGYADLHFVIPETIDNIDFAKGTYNAEEGNFATAGHINFNTKTSLDNSSLKLDIGQFNSRRMLGMFKILDSKRQSAYIATEYQTSDGPFESPQNFNRVNVFGKYQLSTAKDENIGVTLSHFASSWDASGQIPVRAVELGLINRFGAIDDTEGGSTSRSNVLLSYDKFLGDGAIIKNKIYFTRYNFELFSNFTFFLEDSINGDQIRQVERRNLLGYSGTYSDNLKIGSKTGRWHVGVSLRKDQVFGNELSHTKNRKEVLNFIKLGDVDETNLGTFANATMDFGKWTINPGVRVDHFDFQYKDDLQEEYSTQNATQIFVSPKLNILYNHSIDLQLYAKAGRGFHSNDTRVAVDTQGKKILPAAYGFDLGAIYKPIDKILLNIAYWNLYMEQEFVYVGDAGIVEPSGRTSRQGLDLSLRYQPLKWLYVNADANYTLAKSLDDPEGENLIPLAPIFSAVGGLTAQHQSGAYGSLSARWLGDRPANEDYSIVAAGYTVLDANIGYQWPKLSIGLQVQNLLNIDWNEAQFATESRLNFEDEPVEEIHFTPGTPRFVRAIVEYKF